jgi:CubicO group peptidase (beta-lactamase class C family)
MGSIRRAPARALAASMVAFAGLALAMAADSGLVQGFSIARLARLDAAVQRVIDEGQLAGAVLLLTRNRELVHRAELGTADLATGAPLKRDSIVRVYSMTKPVTGVAMMLLHEEGRWRPSDPITRFLPELANLRVYAGTGPDGQPRFEPPKRVPTMGELMTHTAGFAYGLLPTNPVDQMYQKAQPLAARSTAEFLMNMAQLPLAYQPGTQWQYSAAVDLQGAIVERISGQPLAEFMQQRIFGPLGMKDTAFFVPASKLDRVATIYRADPQGKLQAEPRDKSISTPPGFASGGGGLYSTANDYLRFAQMLANGGTLDGQRLLAPRTVALMGSNHLAPELMRGGFGIGLQQIRPGFGFGYDVAVFEDPYLAGSPVGKGSFLWDGAAGTWFWVDPEQHVVFVGIIQRMVGPNYPVVQEMSRPLVYQALLDPR